VKARSLIALALGALMCVGLYGCGGGGGSGMSQPSPSQPMQPMQPAGMMLGVNDVLTKSKAQLDTDDPFDVNGGAVTVNPSNDEESDPVSVD
jgi:hypothetical protein